MTTINFAIDQFEAEAQRLRTLLPNEILNPIRIAPATDLGTTMIHTKPNSQGEFTVVIERELWLHLSLHQRNLLFWHEIAQIQKGMITPFHWEKTGILLGLSFGLVEFMSHHPLSLAVGLTITGFSSYCLYQRLRGEHKLKAKTIADQLAIQFAVRSGYTISQAKDCLKSALLSLREFSTEKAKKHEYQVRLNVLDITFAKHRKHP